MPKLKPSHMGSTDVRFLNHSATHYHGFYALYRANALCDMAVYSTAIATGYVAYPTRMAWWSTSGWLINYLDRSRYCTETFRHYLKPQF